jgi:4-hydroxysphinganine ceramide fatty acyl 2-hydroxylase
MQFEKIHNKGQAQLFKNQYVEMLTKTHPGVIWLMYGSIITWFISLSIIQFQYSVGRIAILFFSGAFVWTFFEYALHRFLFHFLAKSGKAQRFVYVIHGNHHHYPRDRQRLFMPPIPSLIIANVFFISFYLVLGNMGFVFFSGFIFGYLMYGSMHYAIHAFNPPFKFLKPLWRNHHLHHYKNQHMGFGVSTSLWDWVFNTGFDLKNEKEDKEKVKELMFQ